MKTLLDIKQSSIPQSVKMAACDARFVTLVNEAQARLANMGRWWGTYKKLRVCIDQNCVTWPREVKVVEGFNICGIGIPIRNAWYDFQDTVAAPIVGQCMCGNNQLLDRGLVCQNRDAQAPSKVRIYITDPADAGVVVLLQGLDHNGNPVRSSTYDGEQVTLANPMATSTTIFAAPGLTAVQKPLTKGYLKVFALDVATNIETQIATWAPSETRPSYRRTALVRLPVPCQNQLNSVCTDRGDGCNPPLTNCAGATAEAMVRLELLPVVADSDWLLIGNIAAMKAMMRALQKEDENDFQGAVAFIEAAKRELRNELNAYQPPEQTQINPMVYGFSPISRVFGSFT